MLRVVPNVWLQNSIPNDFVFEFGIYVEGFLHDRTVYLFLCIVLYGLI